jgi:diguanylate cyclase (GGDEF)-like protein
VKFATLDVLVVSGGSFAPSAELTAAGLRVDQCASLVAASERLRDEGAAVALAGADLCSGREREAFLFLRSAGAGAVLAVYPPHLAHAAARAVSQGADDGIVVPGEPGTLRDHTLRLVRGGGLADVASFHRHLGDVDRTLDEIVRAFVAHSGAHRCSVMLFDDAHQNLRVRRSVGLPAAAAAESVAAGAGLAGHVARTGRPLVIADVARLPAGVPAPSRRPAKSPPYAGGSCLILPLVGTRGVLGVVCLSDRPGRAVFGAIDVGPLRTLAEHAAQAIENARQHRNVTDLAAIDELTGLANRRQFQRALQREVQRARRYDRQLTLALFDVDHFKRYNDTYGHPAGDRVLATIGSILRTSLREVDIVARYGGEEFAVILPETAARPGAATSPFPFLERLRTRVQETVFEGQDRLPGGRVTLSGGIACFPDDAQSIEDLIRVADEALYESKARGRNTITYRGSPSES